MRPHGRQPTRLPRAWDSPGKNTGVGCHFLLHFCVLVNLKSISWSKLLGSRHRDSPGYSLVILNSKSPQIKMFKLSKVWLLWRLRKYILLLPPYKNWDSLLMWRRKCQPIPVFASGESHGQRGLGGCSLLDHKKLDATEYACMRVKFKNKIKFKKNKKK